MTFEKLSAPEIVNFPQEWFDMNQKSHFWFSWRHQVLRQLLHENSFPKNSPLLGLEIGSGIGFLRQQIEESTSWTVDGADIDEIALQKALPGRGKNLLYRIDEKRESLKEHYDVLIMFDVIEHIEDDSDFLKSALWHLKPGGHLIINVPAMSSLYSQYDRLVGHYRRYNTKTLSGLIQEKTLRLEMVDIRYWGMSLVPLAWIRKQIVRTVKTAQQAIEIGFAPPSSPVNTFISLVMKTETRLFSHPPLGSSLMALIRKQN